MGVYGLLSPRIPIYSPYKYHGSTRTLGGPTRPCPLNFVGGLKKKNKSIYSSSNPSGLICWKKCHVEQKNTPFVTWWYKLLSLFKLSNFLKYLFSFPISCMFFSFPRNQTEPILLTRNRNLLRQPIQEISNRTYWTDPEKAWVSNNSIAT